MSQLLGPDGNPISHYARESRRKPVIGPIAPTWQGTRGGTTMSLPDGGMLQFDTSRLTLGDCRRMAEHPQIASSLYLLTFMVHQMDWQLVGGPARVREHCAKNLEQIWTPLIRSMSLAFKFGFSPNALEWKNGVGNNRIWIDQIKDLVPETVDVRWKSIDGAPMYDTEGKKIIDPVTGRARRNKVEIFDGIRVEGDTVIPAKNSLWYSLLRENGEMRGTKLLRNAFRPWYFHNLVMLYSNNYYERFGSPLPVGRAPYDDQINVGTATSPKYMSGPEVMLNVLEGIKNRSVVVMPSQRTAAGLSDNNPDQDYSMEYLESSLRGAEFTDYLNYLNEEMSMALFTPLLLMRTGSNGSYGQSTTHMQVWQLMLNALAGDLREYINRYVLKRMAHENFGEHVEPPTIEFRKMGKAQAETMRGIMIELLRSDKVGVDVDELGDQIGLTLTEIEELTGEDLPADPGDPEAIQSEGDPNVPRKDKRIGRERRGTGIPPKESGEATAVSKKVALRLVDQISTKGSKPPTFAWGFQRQLEEAFDAEGAYDPIGSAARVRNVVMGCLEDVRETMSKDELRAYIPQLVDIVTDETRRQG